MYGVALTDDLSKPIGEPVKLMEEPSEMTHFLPVAAPVESSLASDTFAAVEFSAGFSQETRRSVVAPVGARIVFFIVL